MAEANLREESEALQRLADQSGSTLATSQELSFRRIWSLIWRCVPFLLPMWKHIVLLLILGAIAGSAFYVGGLVTIDVVSNKILVGSKLQPMQAKVLFLDESYVVQATAEEQIASDDEVTGSDEAAAAESDEDETADLLTVDQRKIVRNRSIFWFALGGLAIIALVSFVPYYGQWVWQSVNQNLRVRMHGQLEHLSLKYHHDSKVGDAIFRLFQDSSMITQVLDGVLLNFIGLLWALLTGTLFIVLFDPLLGLILCALFVPMYIATWKLTPFVRRRAHRNRVANSYLTSQLQEFFAAIRIVKASRTESTVLDKFKYMSQTALDAAFDVRLAFVLLSALVMLLGGLGVIFVEYLIGSWVLDKRDTLLGTALAFLIGFQIWNLGAFQAATGSYGDTTGASYGLVRAWSMVQDLFIGLERAFFLLDLKPDLAEAKSPRSFPQDVNSVRWEDVSFAYASDQTVLDDLSLESTQGEVTALVGASGSGKSTLMSLLLRLYDPDQGNVLVNGIDLRDFSLDQVRLNTSIALQSNVLFAGTIAANIAYARQQATREEIENAARVACAAEFVEELENGYDTELGERGGKLSSGQRQRLSIARALVRDTPILILDEPTAALDAETEHRVLRNLADWGENRVIFLITHRLSTIRNADKIAFLQDGKIVEHGTHDELVAIEGGHYREFVDAEMALAATGTDDV